MVRSLGDVDIHLVTDIDTAYECARWASTHDRLAIDTETSGLSPETDTVRLLQLGDAATAYVIPLEGVVYPTSLSVPGIGSGAVAATRGRPEHGWGGFAQDLLRRMSSDSAMSFVGHNSSFDDSMIRHALDVQLPRTRFDDTRLMAHVLDSIGPLGLKPLSTKHVDPQAALGQDILNDALGKKSGWSWATVPIGFKPYWFYGGLDTCLTYRLSDVLKPRILTEAPKSYELELAVSWSYEDMERKGVRLDQPYTINLLDGFDKHVAQLDAWITANYKVRVNSDAQIIDVLLREGVDLVKKTSSGARYSLDKEVISTLDHPLAKAVLARRQALKNAGYLRAYLGFAGADDIIHPSINSIGGTNKSQYDSGGSGSGVRTGRSSMSEPNLQNVPTRTKEGAMIRRCFIPREGNSWIKVDADQIESRVLAHLSQDPGLIQAFRDDGDFFVNIARRMFDDPEFQKSDPRRQLVKNSMYAKAYGSGVEKFSQTSGIDIEHASSFMRTYDEMFAGVPKFIRKVEAIARERYYTEGDAYVRSPLTGRKHRAAIHKLYPIVNYMIQGMAGELLKLKIIEADNAGLGKYMLFPVHDEIDLDVPTELVPEVLATVLDTMNDDTLMSVPLTWSADIGNSWGTCK